MKTDEELLSELTDAQRKALREIVLGADDNAADAYQRAALRTEKTPNFVTIDPGTTMDDLRMSCLLHGLLGICTETGELQDMVKKHLIYGKEFDPTNVIEECGDLLWYIALTLDAVGFKLSDCMRRNIAKLKTRYPEGFTEEKALTRDLDAERRALEAKAKEEATEGCTHRGTFNPLTGATFCLKCGVSL